MLHRALLSALALLVAAEVTSPASAAEVQQLSFGPTFNTIVQGGRRAVNDHFVHGGNAEVKKNFIRLTTDRQSKRGFVWSKEPVNNDQLMAVLTYRIHGQGKKWFGDGLGLWFTHERAHAPGDNHGFTDKFYGVGIVLDTFRNVEHKGGHKDITVQINDGTKTLDILNDETKQGCDSAFRYHAGSAAFDPVYSASRVRVKIVGNQLSLEVDPRNEGQWTECFNGALPFTREWLRKASIGITASTGSLADNHDVLRLQSFDDVQDYGVAQADAEVWTHNYSKDFESLMDSTACDQNCKITILQKFIANFHIESEHWFEELKEQTENTVTKLREKEHQNHAKIEKLTQRMNEMMENKIGQKLADVKNDVQQKIASQVEGELVVASSGWRLPFFFLLVALAGAFGFAYQKYQKLVKNHLL